MGAKEKAELDEIVRYVISEKDDEQDAGFQQLSSLSEDEQRYVFRAALEAHARDDRLLEYQESSRAA